MNRRISALSTVLIACSTTAWGGSAELKTCLDRVDLGAFKTNQLTACESQELARQDRRLNIEYRKLQVQASANGGGATVALVAAERQWLSYRDAWCNFESIEGGEPGPEFNKAACLAEVTEAQANKIRQTAY